MHCIAMIGFLNVQYILMFTLFFFLQSGGVSDWFNFFSDTLQVPPDDFFMTLINANRKISSVITYFSGLNKSLKDTRFSFACLAFVRSQKYFLGFELSTALL